MVHLFLLASLPRRVSLRLLMRWAYAAQQPQTTCIEAVSSDCQKFKYFFPRDSTMSSLNLQFALQGELHKNKICPSFVRSFKKPAPLLTRSCTDQDSAIKHRYTVQCLIYLLVWESSGEYGALLHMAFSSSHTRAPCSPSPPSLAVSTVNMTSFLQK